MANFPNSVYSPSAVANGQTIDASRDNNQDGEITAIESGYLTGTAPLNSSNSTVATLSVTGGSTLAGTLSVVGGSTFTVRPVLPPPQMAVVFLQSTVTLGSSGASTVAWLADDILINSSMHSTGTNPERLIPQATGVYQFIAQLQYGSTHAGLKRVQILDSSQGSIADVQVNASSRFTSVQAMGYKRYDVLGGYAVVIAGVDGASTNSLSTGTGITWFSMEKR